MIPPYYYNDQYDVNGNLINIQNHDKFTTMSFTCNTNFKTKL